MITLLVANRGEVALRVFRTARAMGMRCVAVYSDADADAMHVRAADEAVRIGPATAEESYLRADRIVDAAVSSGATLVHPGYGFLAEDAGLAEACERAGLTFVGPPPHVLRDLGDKGRARALAARAGLPVLPGHVLSQDEKPGAAAERVGFPLVVKPLSGGGGKGMTVVEQPADLARAIDSARRLGEAAFGSPEVLLERYLPRARHVEVQILADAHGTVVHLGDRDCTIQRRHQKVVEEAPAPSLDPALRERLRDGAVALARLAGYVGAGTCEFVVGAGAAAGFLEVNARLQVEHTVTEQTTGLDIVEIQLLVAQGHPLPVDQSTVSLSGHAVQARIYAEDPPAGFLPSSGTVAHVRWPEGIRVDAGIEEGSEVGVHYDPLLAKVVAHAPDRRAAWEALDDALAQIEVLGVATNVALLREVAADPVVIAGPVWTSWLHERSWAAAPAAGPEVVAAAAVAQARAQLERVGGRDPFDALGPWRISGPRPVLVVVHDGGTDGEHALEVAERDGSWRAGDLQIRPAGDCHGWTVDGSRVAVARGADGTWLVWRASQAHAVHAGPRPRHLEQAGTAQLSAPMPGTVSAVEVEQGQRVARGQVLVVVEAMKMEHPVVAPCDGTVTRIRCSVGRQVTKGEPLVEVAADEEGEGAS